ncbi:MAG: PEGA domain-containing protein [Acidobacteriota bacterium]
MKKAIIGFAFLTLIIAATSELFAQRSRRSPEDHFFLPPRNFFFIHPHYYPPIRLYGRSTRHYGGYSRGYYPRVYRHSRPSASYYPSQGRNPGIYRIYVQSPASRDVVRANSSHVLFKVDPPQAMVYINGKLIGSAGDFSTQRDRYPLLEGEHDLRIEYPGFKPFEARMEVVPNKTLHLDIELEEKND